MNKDECEELFNKVLFEKRKKGNIFFGLKLGMEICRQGLGNIFPLLTVLHQLLLYRQMHQHESREKPKTSRFLLQK